MRYVSPKHVSTLTAIAYLTAFTATALNWPAYAHYILLIAALHLITSATGALLKYLQQNDWREQTATLVHVEELRATVNQSGPFQYYYPAIEYQYEANGEVLTGSTVSIETENVWVPAHNLCGDHAPRSARWWLDMKPGDTRPIRVNPRDASQAVLMWHLAPHRRAHHLTRLVAGGLMISLWLVFVSVSSLLPIIH